MTTSILVQARMGSERFPGKVLKESVGKPLLDHLIERLKQVKNVDSILVVTSNEVKDQPIVDLCDTLKVKVFRGNEENVLERYYYAAQMESPETIVRITADCPLIDPQIIDDVLHFYKMGNFDYASNTLNPTFPRGMDVEVFSKKTLEDTFRRAKMPAEKEHVTYYMYHHPEHFKLGSYEQPFNSSEYRLTVDTPADFELINKIFESLYPKPFKLSDILNLLKEHPDWTKINAHIKQKVVS